MAEVLVCDVGHIVCPVIAKSPVKELNELQQSIVIAKKFGSANKFLFAASMSSTLLFIRGGE